MRGRSGTSVGRTMGRKLLNGPETLTEQALFQSISLLRMQGAGGSSPPHLHYRKRLIL